MRAAIYTVIPFLVLIGLVGCSRTGAPDYPVAYHRALQTMTPAALPADAADRFAALYEQVDQPGYEARTRAFYAPRLYFNDTLTTLDSADQLVAHLGRMHDSGVRIDVEIEEALTNGRDLYLRWSMVAAISVLGRPRTSSTIGFSHLRFDTDGRVILQQDFWDPVQGLYRHVPMLGGAIDSVRKRFDPEPNSNVD
jgi:hypothetical protein